MTTSEFEFPRDELLSCLRGGQKGYEQYMLQVQKMNIEWIYEIIKHAYNILFEMKESPDTKFQALLLIKQMLETCNIPTLTLIEVYIIPTIYQFAIFKPQEIGYMRGSMFFQTNGYSSRIPNIQDTGVKFIRLCSEMLFVGAKIKKNRTLLGEQLNQQSNYVTYYNMFHQKCGQNSPISSFQIQYFDQKFINKGNQKYLQNLKKFYGHKKSRMYSQFFVALMLDSLQTQQNPLFSNTGKTVSTLSTDLDLRKFLKYGDPYITSPLLQQIMQGIKNSQNFMIKKNFLSLLSDFVKWADIQAFVHVLYSDVFDELVPRISEVNGNLGLNQGQNIYPQIKGQRQAKKKFYIEFLKSIQMWAKCIQKDLEDSEENSRAQQYYQFFKVERQFVFPENIMAKKILQDFNKCAEYNSQRNQRLFNKLQSDQTSLFNNKKSWQSSNKRSLSVSMRNKVSIEQVNQKFEKATEIFFNLCDNEEDIPKKMKALVKFKSGFEEDLANIDEENPGQSFQELVDNGDFINEKIKQLQKVYIQYRAKKITYENFKEEYAIIADGDSNKLSSKKIDQGDASISKSSASHSFSKRSLRRMMSDSSQEKVLNSYNPAAEKDTSFHPQNNLFSKISQEEPQKFSGKKSINDANQPFRGSIKEYYEQYNESSANSKRQSKVSKVSKKSEKIRTPAPYSKDKNNESPTFNENKQMEGKVKVQEENHPYYDSSEFMKKSKQQKKQVGPKEPSESSSRFRRKLHHSRNSSQNSKSKSTLRERIQIHRQNRKSSINSNSSRNSYGGRRNSSQNNLSSQQSDSQRISSHDLPTQNINIQSQSYNVVPTTHIHRTDSMRKLDGAKQNIHEKSENFHNHIKSIQQNNAISSHKDQSNNIGISQNQKYSKYSNNSATSFHPFPQNYDYYDGNTISYKKKSLKKWNFKPHNSNQSENPSIYESQRSKEEHKGRSSKSSKSNYMSKKSQKMSENQQNILSSNQQEILSSLNSRESKLMMEEKKNLQYSGNYEGLQTSLFDQDCIQQPDGNPVENSYYGYNQIQKKVRRSRQVPDFKQCLQLDKQVLPVSGKTENVIRKTSLDKGKLFRKGVSAEKQRFLSSSRSKQEEYLMRKLKKEYKKSKDQEIRKTNSRIKKLRNDNSASKIQLSENSDKSKQHSVSKPSFYNHTSKGVISFTVSKNNSGSSSHGTMSKGKQSGMSKIDTQIINGQILNDLPYLRYFQHIQDDKTKRTFLKQKTLLLKNENLQIGTLFNRDGNSLKINLFITPQTNVDNLNIFISKENNVNTKTYPQSFHQLQENKQVKSTIMVTLSQQMFCPPTISINIRKNAEIKQYEVYLPCPITRFLEYRVVQSIHDFLAMFQNQEQNIIKTPWMRMHKKIGKIDNMMEYFPRLTRLGQEGQYTKYGAQCVYTDKKFFMIITTRSPNKFALQGICAEQPRFMEFVMSSLQHIFTLGE